MPPLENFTPTQYQNKGKVWQIDTAPNGIIYMAADEGLLEYDGVSWRTYKGSNGFTRSVLVANDSTIYTGSDLDFGVWHKNKYQAFEYKSLFLFKEESKALSEEFWNIFQLGDNILFISFNNIYFYKQGQLTKIPAPSKFKGSFKVENDIYFVDELKGLFILKNLNLSPLLNSPLNKSMEISGLYKNQGSLFIVSKNKGLFELNQGQLIPINNSISETIKKAIVFDFVQTFDQQLVFGTVLQGILIADSSGNIIHQINKKKGLLNNTILCLHYNSNGKLWFGMDLGVSSIDLKSEFRYIYDYIGDFGSGYTAALQDETFFLGTNQGLYSGPWSALENNSEFYHFTLIAGSEGQVWKIKKIDNSIFVCHDKGLFEVKNNQLITLSTETGFWTIEKVNENTYLSGNYNGIYIFKKEKGQLKLVRKMEDIFGSCNQLILESENSLWVNIPNYGIIHVILNKEFKPEQRKIFEENKFDGENIRIKKTGNNIEVITETFNYHFNKDLNTFEKVSKNERMTILKGLKNGFQDAVSINNEYDFYALYNGFALKKIKKEKGTKTQKHKLVQREFHVFNNEKSLLFHIDTIIPFELNNIRINWVVPNQKEALYQFKMGSKGEWTELSAENTFELLNLKPGKHSIEARAFINNEYTDVQTLFIKIAAPWYSSKYAFLIYVIILALIIYFIFRWQNSILVKQRNNLLYRKENALKEQAEKHKTDVIAMEQEMLQNEFEQLKTQLKNKTLELANKAKENEDKKHLLHVLKEKFEAMQNEPATAKIRLNEIKRLLESHLNVEDHTFEIQMDELNQEFFKKLKSKYPALSMHDLRLCAYLKIGLNSKEIAEIMNILPSSVFVSRSRLRKKLNISAEEDIIAFFNELMKEA